MPVSDDPASVIEKLSRTFLASVHDHGVLFARARDAMSVFEAGTGRFIDVIDAWLALYGYTRDQALELVVTDSAPNPRLDKPFSVDVVDALVRKVITGDRPPC